jgi:hypothetical protein
MLSPCRTCVCVVCMYMCMYRFIYEDWIFDALSVPNLCVVCMYFCRFIYEDWIFDALPVPNLCVFVCMYICIYACIVCAYVCISMPAYMCDANGWVECVSECTYACISVCLRSCMYAYVIQICESNVLVCQTHRAYVPIRYMFVYVCVIECMYEFMRACRYVFTCKHVRICVGDSGMSAIAKCRILCVVCMLWKHACMYVSNRVMYLHARLWHVRACEVE